MIEPATWGGEAGMRATAEPSRGADAEQANEFSAVLWDAAAVTVDGAVTVARAEPRISTAGRMNGAFPVGIAAVTAQELTRAGPTKATVAAALEEQVSPAEKPEAPARLATDRGQQREMPVAVHPAAPALHERLAEPQVAAQQPGSAAPERHNQQRRAAVHRSAAATTPAAVNAAAETSRPPVATPGSSGAAVATRTISANSPTVLAIGRSGAAGLSAGRGKLVSPPAMPPPREPAQAQFARGLAAALRQGGGTVLLHLKPELLGDLRIRMDIRGGSVAAEFQVRTSEARGLLQETLDTLRTVLEAKGLDVERLSVQLAERKDEHAAQDAPPRDAEDWGDERQGGRGPRDERSMRSARMPELEAGMEVLELPGACAELHAELGGVPRINAIA